MVKPQRPTRLTHTGWVGEVGGWGERVLGDWTLPILQSMQPEPAFHSIPTVAHTVRQSRCTVLSVPAVELSSLNSVLSVYG